MGSRASPDEPQDDNVIHLLCEKIIKPCRNQMADSMNIVLYQFCSLLVQKCAHHIHDVGQKSQSDRLRTFMLFAWPTLHQSHTGRDITEKYTGHFLLANIIDKFAINRKIVLQVLNSLMKANQLDHKEIIRRTMDIIVPAVPKRMEDGCQQLFQVF